jgi:hypothetical protein
VFRLQWEQVGYPGPGLRYTASPADGAAQGGEARGTRVKVVAGGQAMAVVKRFVVDA